MATGKSKVSHGETVRREVLWLRRQTPFEPFALVLRDGLVLPIRHPENIALDPGDRRRRRASLEFGVISGMINHAGSFASVDRVSPLRTMDETAPASSSERR